MYNKWKKTQLYIKNSYLLRISYYRQIIDDHKIFKQTDTHCKTNIYGYQ